MKFRIIVCAMAVLLSAFVNIAQANGFSISAKGGIPRVDLNLGISGVSAGADEETVFGLTVGYEISNFSAIELEFARGTAEFNASDSITSISSDVDITTIGLYYTQRTGGDLYFIFKSGIVREEVSFSGATPGLTDDTVGFSWGLGGGYRVNQDFSVEAEYVQIESDIAWILFSARYAFSL